MGKVIEGFFLGLGNGSTCMVHCIPIVVPYLLGEGKRPRGTLIRLGEFMLGRLVGYLCFAFFAWGLGQIVIPAVSQQLFLGSISIVLSLTLLMYVFFSSRTYGKSRIMCYLHHVTVNRQWFFPGVLGFITGISLCPPFLLAFSNAMILETCGQSCIFFLAFFIGTTVYFIPSVVCSYSHLFHSLRVIGKMSTSLVALYFFYKGVVILCMVFI